MADADAEGLLAAALELIETAGWAGYGPLKLAERTGASLAACCMSLPDRAAVLAAIGRRADDAMTAVDVDELVEMTPRERVFELVMRRLEGLAFAKPALRTLPHAAAPDTALAVSCNLRRGMTLLSETADATAPGARGWLSGPAVAAVYVQTARVWLGDDDPDQSATMAELDKRLTQAAAFLRPEPGA
ncbi:MAG: hypothetical protein AAFX81_05145 [Pseudomonadota bacterium]